MTDVTKRRHLAVGLGLLAAVAAVCVSPVSAQEEREPERPLLRNIPQAELDQMLVPSFCRTEAREARAGQGHPKFGMAWCQMLATDQAAGGEDAGSMAKLVEFGRAFQPFCREGGAGHPQFGIAWCTLKSQSLLAGAQFRAPDSGPSEDEGVAPFCRPGGDGHPKWGLDWCSMTEAQRHRLGEPGNGNVIREEDGLR